MVKRVSVVVPCGLWVSVPSGLILSLVIVGAPVFDPNDDAPYGAIKVCALCGTAEVGTGTATAPFCVASTPYDASADIERHGSGLIRE